MPKQAIQADEVRMISAEEYAQRWDQERRVTQFDPLIFSLRTTVLYVPARTKADMDTAMGAPTQTVRTRTFPDYRVWIAPCRPDHPEARTLRPTTETQGAAVLAFAVQLRKLGLKLPKTRQYTLPARRLPVEGGGVVYEITFAEFVQKPRNVVTATAAAKRAKPTRGPKAPKVAEPAAPATTGPLAKEE